MERNSVIPLLAVLAPFLSLAAIIVLPRPEVRLKKIVHVAASVASFALILTLLPRALDGEIFNVRLFSITNDIGIALRVDTIGYYFGLLISFMWVLATLYSLRYIEHQHDRFFGFLALVLCFSLGAAFAENVVTYFIFYELMTFGSYPLIVHEETPEARRAALKYLVYAIFGGTVLIFALVAHFYWGGNMSFNGAGTLDAANISRAALITIFISYLAGFGVKSAIMPLHGWVPDAHPAAPSPASALLSGVILKLGAFGIIRIVFNVFGVALMRDLGMDIVLAVVASVTIVLASFFALTQDNLKRRLAYSSIGQVSYILLGVALLSADGAMGGVMHIAHHALMKGTLFFCAGIIIIETGKKDISEMEGIGFRLPFTMICFSVAALAMMGIPPSVGFVTKWLLGVGALQAREGFYIIVLLVSALLNAAYFLPIIYTAFFKGEAAHPAWKGETSRFMLWPALLTSGLVIFGGIYITMPGLPYSFARMFVRLFGGG